MALNTGVSTHIPDRTASLPKRLDFTLHGRPVRLYLGAAARRELARGTMLWAELELYFSCLVRKRVLCYAQETPPGDPEPAWIEVVPGLHLRLRAVVTAQCAIDALEGAPPLQAMPVRRPAAMVPRWVRIDHGRHGWQGTFGYEPTPTTTGERP